MRGTGTRTRKNPTLTTVAILGDSPVVCHAISHLLELGGYETRLIEASLEDAVLSDVDLVLVAAGTAPGRWGSLNLEGTIPVMKLVDTPEEKEFAGERGILWPCTAGELQSSVASAIGREPAGEPIESE